MKTWFNIEKELINKVEEINNFLHPLECTSKYVWGKTVEYGGYKKELNEYYVELKIEPEMLIKDIVEKLKLLCLQEEIKMVNKEKFTNCEFILHQLNNWNFLFNEAENIISPDGVVTMVKYMTVLPKESSNNMIKIVYGDPGPRGPLGSCGIIDIKKGDKFDFLKFLLVSIDNFIESDIFTDNKEAEFYFLDDLRTTLDDIMRAANKYKGKEV